MTKVAEFEKERLNFGSCLCKSKKKDEELTSLRAKVTQLNETNEAFKIM